MGVVGGETNSKMKELFYFGRVDDVGQGACHALPDARQVPQVENVVELRRRR